MSWLSRLRHPQPAASPTAAGNASSSIAAAPAREAGWAYLPPLQRTIDPAPSTTRPMSFPHTLSAWTNPSLTGRMSHAVTDSAPAGVIDGDGLGHGPSTMSALPVAQPASPAGAPDMPLSTPPAASPPRPVQRATSTDVRAADPSADGAQVGVPEPPSPASTTPVSTAPIPAVPSPTAPVPAAPVAVDAAPPPAAAELSLSRPDNRETSADPGRGDEPSAPILAASADVVPPAAGTGEPSTAGIPMHLDPMPLDNGGATEVAIPRAARTPDSAAAPVQRAVGPARATGSVAAAGPLHDGTRSAAATVTRGAGNGAGARPLLGLGAPLPAMPVQRVRDTPPEPTHRAGAPSGVRPAASAPVATPLDAEPSPADSTGPAAAPMRSGDGTDDAPVLTHRNLPGPERPAATTAVGSNATSAGVAVPMPMAGPPAVAVQRSVDGNGLTPAVPSTPTSAVLSAAPGLTVPTADDGPRPAAVDSASGVEPEPPVPGATARLTLAGESAAASRSVGLLADTPLTVAAGAPSSTAPTAQPVPAGSPHAVASARGSGQSPVQRISWIDPSPPSGAVPHVAAPARAVGVPGQQDTRVPQAGRATAVQRMFIGDLATRPSLPTGSLPTTAPPTTAQPTSALPTAALPAAALPTGALPTPALPAAALPMGAAMPAVNGAPTVPEVPALPGVPAMPTLSPAPSPEPESEPVAAPMPTAVPSPVATLPAPPAASAVEPTAASAAGHGAAGTVPTDPRELDHLAKVLIEPLTRRIRAEMIIDRERRGVRSDVR